MTSKWHLMRHFWIPIWLEDYLPSGCNNRIDLVIVQIYSNAEQDLERSYWNRPVVISTKHCQSFTAFFGWCALFIVDTFLFCISLSKMKVHWRNLFLLSTHVAQMLLTQKDEKKYEKQMKRFEIVIQKYMITNNWRQTFDQPQSLLFLISI